MEKMIRGSIVSVLGFISLVTAIVLVNTGDVEKHIDLAFASGVLGTIAFFVGIWMIPSKSKL
jgi:uncharacterized membrane protein YozB (DUF420 family)